MLSLADANVAVSGICATARLGATCYTGNPIIPDKRWMESPSVVEVETGTSTK